MTKHQMATVLLARHGQPEEEHTHCQDCGACGFRLEYACPWWEEPHPMYQARLELTEAGRKAIGGTE